MSDTENDAVQTVQIILDELKARAREAESRGDVYVFGIYNQLLKVVSPIATKAFKRQLREDNARINKSEKAMRKSRKHGGDKPKPTKS